MRPFWHPLSVLVLGDPPSYATSGLVRMLVRAEDGLELVYAGDRMWPAVASGQRLRVQPPAPAAVEPGAVVVAEVDGIPDLLRVAGAAGGAVELVADADPDVRVRVPGDAILARTDLPAAPHSAARARRRRRRLDHREAWRGRPDPGDDPASTVLQKYDLQAPYYAASGARLQDALARRIRRTVRPGGRILVAGSGTGLECFALAEAGYAVVGVDFAPRMIEIAAREAERRGAGVSFRLADLREHEEPEGSLAAVLFTYDVYSFLPQVDRRRELLIKMSRWLEPGGSVLLSARRPGGAYDRWILTLQWLRRGLRSWGHTHTRWVSADGILRRSFVQVHRDRALAREVGRAGFLLGAWEGGHTVLRRRGDAALEPRGDP